MSPSPDDEGSLTIKYGGDFAAPWLVLKGHPSAMRRQLIEAFGYDETELEGVDLASLVAKAAVDSAAMYALAGGGATPESNGGRRSGGRKGSTNTTKPSAATEEPTADADTQRVVALIAAAASPEELKEAWAKNQESFEGNKTLQQAYKARSKELKGTN